MKVSDFRTRDTGVIEERRRANGFARLAGAVILSALRDTEKCDARKKSAEDFFLTQDCEIFAKMCGITVELLRKYYEDVLINGPPKSQELRRYYDGSDLGETEE